MSPLRSSKTSSPALLSFDEAAALVAAYAAKVARSHRPRSLGIERVRLNEALGRVLAEPLRADADQPPFARSTRDGFACRAAEVSTHRPLAVVGSTRAGQSPSGSLPRGSAWEIMTGAPVPAGADAVVMLEHVEEVGSRNRSRHPPPAAAHHSERRKHRRSRRSGAQRRQTSPRRHLDHLCADRACGVLRLDYAGCLPEAARSHSLHRRRARAHRSYARPQPDSQLEQRDAGGNGLRCRRRSLGAAHRSRHSQVPRRRARPRRCCRSSAHHRRRLRRQIRSGRTGSRPRRSTLSLHWRSHPARQAVCVWRVAAVPAHRSNGQRATKNGTKCCCFGLPGNPVSSAVTFLLFAAPVVAALAGRRDRVLASLSRVSPRTSKPRPASPAFSPLPALLPVPFLRSRSFPGRARAISLPWLAPTVSWSCLKTPIAFAQARLSAFCFPEEFLCQSPRAARPRASRISTASGQASMVDVGSKQPTRRTATASAFVELSAAVLAALPSNPKGNPLEVARFAGIQAAKRTADLIPMCHPLALTHVDVQAAIVARRRAHHVYRVDNRSHRRRNGGPHRRRRCRAHRLRHDQGARQGHRHSRHSPRIQIRRQERGFFEKDGKKIGGVKDYSVGLAEVVHPGFAERGTASNDTLPRPLRISISL